MRSLITVTILFALAAGGTALAYSDANPRAKSEDAAAMREAIRFERAKDAADRKQLRIEASRLRQAPAAGESSSHPPGEYRAVAKAKASKQ